MRLKMNVQSISNLLGTFNPDWNSNINRNYSGFMGLGKGVRSLLDRQTEQERYEKAQADKAEALEREEARYLNEQARKDREEAQRQAEFRWRQDEAEAARQFAREQQENQRAAQAQAVRDEVATAMNVYNVPEMAEQLTKDDIAKLSDLRNKAMALNDPALVSTLDNKLKEVAAQVQSNMARLEAQRQADLRWKDYTQGRTIKKAQEEDKESAKKQETKGWLTGLRK